MRCAQAIANAGIERLDDVHFVQVKCPCVTVARAAAAIAAGKTPLTNDPNKSMAFARAAGAFGVALALDEIKPDDFDDASLLAISPSSRRAPAFPPASRSKATR